MARIIGVILLVVGLSLLILGVQTADALASQVSEFFTGRPTDRAIWLMIGGLLSIAAGLFFTVQKIR